MSWIEKYPKQKIGNDLIGVRLMISEEKPPQETTFKGMMEIVIFEVKDTSKQYNVIATKKDIETMCNAYKLAKPFTYVKEEDEKYAHVEVVEPAE